MDRTVDGIKPISAALTRPLRQRVLRPHQRAEELVYLGDDFADTLHLGAYRGGELVGIASVCRERCPEVDEPEAWRLRGMATLPECRGEGLGAQLLDGCIRHARDEGGRLFWCTARIAALNLYLRRGMVTVGEQFEIEPLGMHYVMTLDLTREG